MQNTDVRIRRIAAYAVVTALFLSLAPVAEIPGSTVAEPADLLNQRIEEAALGENWKRTAEFLDRMDDSSYSSAARFVKGHACLALNRNNESLRLFLDASSKEGLKEWDQWAADLVARNPGSAVAHYLKGDALARNERWDEALESLDQALRIKPDYPLALDARGVVLCAMGRWDKAESDFLQVCKVDSSFADGQAALGTCKFLTNRHIAAADAYDHALKLSPEFALAMNGRGCIKFKSGPKEWEEATEEFENADKQLSLSLFYFNADVLYQAAAEAGSKANLYFQPADFTNWDGLKLVIEDKSSILHPHFRDMSLPEEVDRTVIDSFNNLLEEKTFYEESEAAIGELIGTIIKDPDGTGIGGLLAETKIIRSKSEEELDSYDRSAIRGLNRCLLEELYPTMIARAGSNEAGMSLTRTGGLAYDGYAYKQTLSNRELLGGLNRIDNVYRPMADFLQETPVVKELFGWVGHKWNRHLDPARSQNIAILQDRGLVGGAVHPGGVSTEEIMASFFREDDWTVVNWFGLAYKVLPEQR